MSEGFNVKVHERDSKGNIKRANHYRLTIKDGVKTFERPPGSGFFYAENGALIASPKVRQGEENVLQAPAKQEFNSVELLAQLEALKAENASLKGVQIPNEPPVGSVSEGLDELPEVHMTVNDVVVEDVVVAPQVDISEEIALMDAAGADTSALKKPFLSKPSFLK